MTENPYAIPVDDLVNGARVSLAEQVEMQDDVRQPAADWTTGQVPMGDGADADCD
jgi:hypothetical protein